MDQQSFHVVPTLRFLAESCSESCRPLRPHRRRTSLKPVGIEGGGAHLEPTQALLQAGAALHFAGPDGWVRATAGAQQLTNTPMFVSD